MPKELDVSSMASKNMEDLLAMGFEKERAELALKRAGNREPHPL